jgi:hypothetical protein
MVVEIARLGTPSPASGGAIAFLARTGLGGWTPMGVACALLEGVFVLVTLALFLAWLSSWEGRGYPLTGPDCTSYGKGGAYCSGQSTTGDRTDDDCVSLGRGGLLCKVHPGKTGLAG